MGCSFCPVAPHKLALVSGTKVGLWQPAALKETSLEEGRSMTKFKDVSFGLMRGNRREGSRERGRVTGDGIVLKRLFVWMVL